MSESLRDQLKKAGFKDTTPPREKRQKSGSQQRKKMPGRTTTPTSSKPRKPNNSSTKQAEDAARATQKKEIKEKIKILIETNRIKDHIGTVAFSYLLGSRVKQLFVTDECQKKLANAELLITRLNGNTYLIPPETAKEVLALNPDWALITAGGDEGGEIDEAYADYQVPDDLSW